MEALTSEVSAASFCYLLALITLFFPHDLTKGETKYGLAGANDYSFLGE